MRFVIISLLLLAQPADAVFKTKQGLIVHNPDKVCVTQAATEAAIQLAVDELARSCTKWKQDEIESALVGAQLYWVSSPWVATSDSCRDLPDDLKFKNDDSSYSCSVIGLYSYPSNVIYVYYGGVWTDTLTHELAHLFQTRIDGKPDPHHLQFAKDGCIDIALKKSVERFKDEMYSNPKYACE